MVLKIKGVVGKGLGQSSQWMPKYLPDFFPGTLNVTLEESMPNIRWHTITETHWKDKPLKIADCLINDIEAKIIFPPLANVKKRPRLLEIGSTVKLRDLLKLVNGDVVEITFI